VKRPRNDFEKRHVILCSLLVLSGFPPYGGSNAQCYFTLMQPFFLKPMNAKQVLLHAILQSSCEAFRQCLLDCGKPTLSNVVLEPNLDAPRLTNTEQWKRRRRRLAKESLGKKHVRKCANDACSEWEVRVMTLLESTFLIQTDSCRCSCMRCFTISPKSFVGRRETILQLPLWLWTSLL